MHPDHKYSPRCLLTRRSSYRKHYTLLIHANNLERNLQALIITMRHRLRLEGRHHLSDVQPMYPHDTMTWLTLENPFLDEFIGLGSRLQRMFKLVLTAF